MKSSIGTSPDELIIQEKQIAQSMYTQKDNGNFRAHRIHLFDREHLCDCQRNAERNEKKNVDNFILCLLKLLTTVALFFQSD